MANRCRYFSQSFRQDLPSNKAGTSLMKHAIQCTILFCALASIAVADPPAELKCDLRSWAGQWQTSYGVMHLRFDDEKFTGHYGSSKHAVRGRFDPKTPCTLRGVWQHTGSTSTGRFTFRINGKGTFKGNWSTGDADPDVSGSPWAGKRPAVPVVSVPHNLTLAELQREQARQMTRLDAEYARAYRQMLTKHLAAMLALHEKLLQQGNKRKADEVATALAKLRREIESIPPVNEGHGGEEGGGETPDPPLEPGPEGGEIFNDANLEAAIRKALVKPNGAITRADLVRSEKFEASFSGITDISGLQHAVNLTTLDLSHNPISDFSPLAGLTKLKRLLLYKVRITDLRPLADLTNVEFVSFWETQVSDLRPLANWKKLKSIELRLTKVTDYTLLHQLPRLKLIATNRRLISDAQLAGLRKALPNCRLEIERRPIEH